jgi:hypothetical protein
MFVRKASLWHTHGEMHVYILQVIECDQDEDGNAIRAELGKRTGRTSMPSIWIRGHGWDNISPLFDVSAHSSEPQLAAFACVVRKLCVSANKQRFGITNPLKMNAESETLLFETAITSRWQCWPCCFFYHAVFLQMALAVLTMLFFLDGRYVGGCNDGPGVAPLHKEGKLQGLLSKAGAL